MSKNVKIKMNFLPGVLDELMINESLSKLKSVIHKSSTFRS